MDEYTEVEHEGWFERIKNAIGGVLIGLAMFVGAIVLLFWNEGRAVQRARTLEEGRSAVQSIQPDKKNAASGKDLVHLSGKAKTGATVRDRKFKVQVDNAIGVRRRVEMYQWKENKSVEKTESVGGDVEKETTYSYQKVWTDDHIDSSRFKKSSKHSNPSEMPYQSKTTYAETVTVGAFELPSGLVRKIDKRENLPMNNEHLEKLPQNMNKKTRIQSGQFYMGSDPDKPSVGDVRVSFQKIPETTVSLVAKPVNGTFEPYTSDEGGEIFMLKTGTHSANSMFEAAEEFNMMLTWGLRLAGFLIMAFGISLMFRPLEVVASVIPILGDLVGLGTGLFAGGIAFVVSLTTIAFGWIFYRPVIGISLLVVVAVVMGGLLYLAFGDDEEETTARSGQA